MSVLPDANTLMGSTESLKDEQAHIFNEVLRASHQKEVIDQHLGEKKNTQDMRSIGITDDIMMLEFALGTF